MSDDEPDGPWVKIDVHDPACVRWLEEREREDALDAFAQKEDGLRDEGVSDAQIEDARERFVAIILQQLREKIAEDKRRTAH